MDNFSKIFLNLMVVMFLCSCLDCKLYPKGGPYYYASWNGYSIPYKPERSISFEDAQKQITYYEAFFDNESKLISFKKYLNGKLDWFDQYEYAEKRLIKRILTKSNGKVVTQFFDEKGKIVNTTGEPSEGEPSGTYLKY